MSVPSNVLENLLRVLEKERAALRSGDIGALKGLAKRKAALVDLLPSGAAGASSGELVERVRARAEGNAALLRAWREGASAAKARIARLEAERNEVGVYAVDGRRIETGAQQDRPVTRL